MGSTTVGGRSPVLVKLGGSLITRKREVEKIRPKVLARLCREIASILDPPVVLLHGAGSFGHPGARAFGLDRPPEDGSPARARGAAIVSVETRRLHLYVLRELVRAGARPSSVPLATHARNRAGQVASIDPRPIEDALSAGMLPVSFGDVVPDETWDFSVLSADTIAAALAPLLHAGRVVFVSDVPGFLEPGRGGRRSVVSEVTDEIAERLGTGTRATDVTGGAQAKARAMRRIAAAGADAVLISGLTDGAVSRAIRGEAVYGSWAHARPR
jgi:isopentenyl phosphate kinase